MILSTQLAVERLLESRSRRRAMPPLSETHGDLTLEHAYAIQDALRAELERRGQQPIGWKLAATSAPTQALVGVQHPVVGFLFPEQYASGAEVSVGRFAELVVEVEVAFRMRTRLVGPGVTAATAAPAVADAMPALELPDFLLSGKPRAGDFIANSVLARAIVLGPPFTPLAGLDLAQEEVVYEHNGEVVGTHRTAEVMGNPLNALAWLANHLAARGLALKPGDVVMSGSISKLLRPKAGDTIRARFTHLGSVSIRVVN
ncbi:MAG TPA: fumarylacetoacetate hydrolase family protein [Methylomirabilota bacterium]|nr:fumarylacetoacetate hydrolase family protein [Methylomirabilota bacterium]